MKLSNPVKLALILNDQKLSGKLTKFWTGCYAYHSAWVDTETNTMYDMHKIRRKRHWPHYGPETTVILFDQTTSNVTREYLEEQLKTDENEYGWKDYCLFALRPLFHLFGKQTVNVGGIICSEMTNVDVWNCKLINIPSPWKPEDAPPSPCDQLRWAVKDLEEFV